MGNILLLSPTLSLAVAGVVVLAYLIGSIPTAVWVSRRRIGADIRTLGSGNAGSTNAYRVMGRKAGMLVQVVDIAKGALAALLPLLLLNDAGITGKTMLLLRYCCGLAAVLGHIYPIWAGFRGGKGMNTILGMMLTISQYASGFAVVVFIVTLYLSEYVSLSSMLAMFSLPVYQLLMNEFYDVPIHTWPFIISCVLPLLVVYTHRANIQRIRAHAESRVNLFHRRHANS